MPELSIVLPTCNRANLLARCIDSVLEATRCDFELIVVDGASTDHTPDVLSAARRRMGSRLKVIRETRRAGFVKAANQGFAAARGNYLTWINDDARPLRRAFDNAIAQLIVGPSGVGLIAMHHRWHGDRNIAMEKLGPIQDCGRFQLCHVRGTLYANFGLGRRDVLQRLGFFDERFEFYGADPDLSLKCWYSGLTVAPAMASFIDHDEVADERRSQDIERGRRDNAELFAKWDLPPVNAERNDFDLHHPCTLRGLNSSARAA